MDRSAKQYQKQFIIRNFNDQIEELPILMLQTGEKIFFNSNI